MYSEVVEARDSTGLFRREKEKGQCYSEGVGEKG